MFHAMMIGMSIVVGLYALATACRVSFDSIPGGATLAMVLMLLVLASLNFGFAVYRIAVIFGRA